MLINVFSVYDSKACFFGQPFFDQHEASAIRNFSDAVNDASNPNNMWNKHPEDFSLFQIGSFHNETGELVPIHPKNLITASALRSLKNPEPFQLHGPNGTATEEDKIKLRQEMNT